MVSQTVKVPKSIGVSKKDGPVGVSPAHLMSVQHAEKKTQLCMPGILGGSSHLVSG